ncbi:hypothetical protein T439DRAFT_326874 [Meredithblackwellia eburnea MCA 4105]
MSSPISLSPSQTHVDIGASTELEKGNRQPTTQAGPGGPPGSGLLSVGIKKTVGNGVILVLTFWFVAMWLFGTLYKSSEKAYRLNVIVADFDQGPVGAALLQAINSVNGQNTYPTFHIVNASTTTPEELQHRTFTGEFWGSMWANEGSSASFTAAIANDATAATYDPTKAWSYAGLEVRYITVWQGYLLTSFQKIVIAGTQAFVKQTVVPHLTTLNSTLGANSARVLAAPVASTYVNLAPLQFGVRAVLNTIAFVYPALFCFFFILGMNGIFMAEGLYQKFTFRDHVKVRVPAGLIWTLIAGLSIISWPLVYDESYSIKAKNFFALWTLGWVSCQIYFDLLDALTTFLPMPFIPPITVSMIVLSVSSTLSPIQLANNFYRIQYAFWPHAVWETMITIYGNGAANKLYYNLPVLAAWLVIGKVGIFFAMKKRAREFLPKA